MPSSDIDAWRQQLAADLGDSDDDDNSPHLAGEFMPPPQDTDLGLKLDEMPLPKRAPAADLPGGAGGGSRMPPRAGQAPALGSVRGGGGGGDPPEVMAHRLQILELKLEEREIELEALRKQANMGSNELNDAREAKMKDLAKRAKAATMALNRERAKAAQFGAELDKLKKDGAVAPGGGGAEGGSAAARLEAAKALVADGREGLDPAARERELKEARDRLGAANARLHEAKVSLQAVKADLERHKRALVKEVGEEAKVSELLDEASGAKGRAQQIALLKQQVKGLTAKLSSLAGGVEGADADAVGLVPPTPTDGADERQRGALNAIEQDRRREHERALLREQELAHELGESRKKADALAARIKTLEGQVKSSKDKLRVLLEKSDADDQLVRALKAELDKHRKGGGGGGGVRRRSAARRARGGGGAAGAGGADAERRAGEVAARLASQQTQIDRQEQIILALREQLERQQQQQSTTAAAPGAARVGSRPGSGRHPQDVIVLQTENAKLRELVQLLQDKLAEATSEDTY